MRGLIKGHIQHRRQHASRRKTDLEDGHIAFLPVPWPGTGRHGGNAPTAQGSTQGFLAVPQLPDMRKNGVALAKSPLPV